MSPWLMVGGCRWGWVRLVSVIRFPGVQRGLIAPRMFGPCDARPLLSSDRVEHARDDQVRVGRVWRRPACCVSRAREDEVSATVSVLRRAALSQSTGARVRARQARRG